MTRSGTNSRSRRYVVVGALFILSLITYIDRAAISTAKGPMATELSLSDGQVGAVFDFVKDRVYALDAKTGRLIPSFGKGGHMRAWA